jgi:ketosteroid isomerase-like protein
MYKWLVARRVRSTFAAFSAGDVDAVLATFGPQAHFTFPGTNAWSLDTRDPAEISAWFRRFVEVGPSFTVKDVWVKGPPWNLRVAVRMSDEIGSYRNEVAQYLHFVRGRLVRDQIYLDTQAVERFEVERRAGRAARPER